MKYFVPINPQSVKKNPNAGNTVYQQQLGPAKTTIERYVVDPPSHYTHYIYELWGPIETPLDFTKLKPVSVSSCYEENCSKEEVIKITQDTPIQTLYSLSPEPSHHYSYQNIEVECENCGNTVKLNELYSDSYYDDEGDYYSSTICPRCHSWECCELEYEKFNKEIHV